MPELPLFSDEAEIAVQFFDRLRLSNVGGTPLLKDACADWFRDIVRALFGSRDPATNIRYIREIFALAPKGSSKTTYGAALMVVALLMNTRPRAEFLLVGPTQATAERAFEAAKGMVALDPVLEKRFRPRDHKKDIRDLVTGSRLKIATFDLKILTGAMPVGVLVDELHEMSKNANAAKVLVQIRGGINKNTEGFLAFITTQSDAVPVGAFKAELHMARNIRDGRTTGRMLPVLYEFPDDIARDEAKWSNPENWSMVNPNLGRSIHLNDLVEGFNAANQKGMADKRVWASQHLNIEVGVGLRTDMWAGAEYWTARDDAQIDLEALLDRCEVVIPGVDGGGLDDLFGLTVLGRCRETKQWLSWSHGWCHRGVLERRKSIASTLEDFAAAGELTIVDDELDDVSAIVAIIAGIKHRGLLACVAVDPAGLGEMVDALDEIGITAENELLKGAPQGFAMMNAIKTAERKLANRTLWHAPSKLMAWCVGNLKIEPMATAIRATKQNAGDAKIDPVMALFNAVTFMSLNPQPQGGSVYDNEETYQEAFGAAAAPDEDDGSWKSSILADPDHPLFAEHRRRFEAWQDQQDDD
ncbi:MAG: terminase [Rhodospirillaceae bacterium]|nr:MAG: terminase [Rhodospirillaceae bacterium]